MKRTLHIKILLFALITFVFMSCGKNGIFTAPQDKIIGQWSYVSVKFSHNFTTDDLTQEYKNLILDFRNQRDVFLIDERSGNTQKGTWTMKEDTYTTEESTYTTYSLFLSFYDTTTGDIQQQLWDEVSVGKRYLRGTENYSDGSVSYKLERK